MKRNLAVVPALVVFAIAIPIAIPIAGAEPPANPQTPPLHVTVRSAIKAETRTLFCSPTSAADSGRARVDCIVSITQISPPKPAPTPTAAELAAGKRELAAKIAKDGDKFWRSCTLPAITDPNATDFERDLQSNLTAACSKHDANAFYAIAVAAQGVAAQTCHVGTSSYKAVFEQVDANTWQETDGPTGLCNVTSITTLVRVPKASSLWNYREITNVANTSGEFCSGRQPVTVSDLSWDARKSWQFNCKYFEN